MYRLWCVKFQLSTFPFFLFDRSNCQCWIVHYKSCCHGIFIAAFSTINKMVDLYLHIYPPESLPSNRRRALSPRRMCSPQKCVFLPLMRCTADESSCPPGERETAAGAINYQPKIEPTPPSPTHLLPEQ